MKKRLHDPGGKIVRRLPQGMDGDAHFFGERDEYRQWLSRTWRDDIASPLPFAVWIGLNPSVADGKNNDPTICREITFTRTHCGLSSYYKVNVMDYRSTSPKGLLAPGVDPRSEGNLQVIRDLASRAEIIVIACGVPHNLLKHYVTETISILKDDNRRLWCLSKTAAGWPKHSLYVSGKTPFEDFTR